MKSYTNKNTNIYSNTLQWKTSLVKYLPFCLGSISWLERGPRPRSPLISVDSEGHACYGIHEHHYSTGSHGDEEGRFNVRKTSCQKISPKSRRHKSIEFIDPCEIWQTARQQPAAEPSVKFQGKYLTTQFPRDLVMGHLLVNERTGVQRYDTSLTINTNRAMMTFLDLQAGRGAAAHRFGVRMRALAQCAHPARRRPRCSVTVTSWLRSVPPRLLSTATKLKHTQWLNNPLRSGATYMSQ